MKNKKIKNLLFIISIAIFTCAIYFTYTHLDISLSAKDSLEIATLVAPPIFLGFLINTLILCKLLNFNKKHIHIADAFKLSIISTTASLLPFAGSALAKIAILKSKKISLFRSGKTVFLSIVTYIMAATSLASLSLSNNEAISAIMHNYHYLLVAILITCIFIHKLNHYFIASLYTLNLSTLILDSLRIFLIFPFIHPPPDVSEILILQLSNLSSLGGSLAPGNIGIKEASATLLGGLMSLDPHATYLCFSINRLYGYIFLLLAALTLLRVGNEK